VTHQRGNLGSSERTASALLGLAFSVLAMRRGGGLVRAATGAVGLSLLSRAFAGHCAMKAAFSGQTSLRQGISDQLRHMRDAVLGEVEGLKSHAERRAAGITRSRAVDEASKESFPASDPPASRLPDVPPANADAKWEAAREAERKGRPI
jgi:hypothetical protein